MSAVAIMQPTFIPWMGYFALIEIVDDFIFLDNVQFSKQSWQSRNRIKGPDGAITLSLGVSRNKSKPLISEVELADNGFEKKLLKTIKGCLSKAQYCDLVLEIIENAFNESEGSLSVLNRIIITNIAQKIGITTRLHLASSLDLPEDKKWDRLVTFCKKFNAVLFLLCQDL